MGFVTYLSIKPKKLNVHNAKVQYAPYVVEKNSIIKMFVIYVTWNKHYLVKLREKNKWLNRW